MKFKKSIALMLAALTLAGAMSGCGEKKEVDGKINLSVSNWPDETNQQNLDIQNGLRDSFMEKYENINLIPDTYKYDTKTFVLKASANQMPTFYSTWFTEIKQIIKQGYAADITDVMKEFGYDAAINPSLIELVTGDDGRIYGVPVSVYAQGLYINKKIFKEAGLVNEDGSVKLPNTYQELAEYSEIIKEKTGKAGFIMPTTNNTGGWQFLNIAWSYGVEFCRQREDGTWEAAFDTQETRDALQYIKDLKWKYNGLMDETVINQDDIYKYFGANQGAMMICNPPADGLKQKYGMDIDEICLIRMPEGPKGRYSQMGGTIWVFAQNATTEQIEAGLLWLEHTGFTNKNTEEILTNYRTTQEQKVVNNQIILNQETFDVWVDPETIEKRRAVQAEYCNVNPEDYADYFSFEGVTINPEPAACAQQLYAILDGCIQEVITNENADVDKLIKTAANDYQVNHLDKM